MKGLWMRAMMFFVLIFFAALFFLGLRQTSQDTAEEAARKAEVIRVLQEKEEAAKRNLLKDPQLLNTVSLVLVLVLAAGSVTGVRALVYRMKHKRWPVEGLEPVETRWGGRQVFQALLFVLFLEACFFFLHIAAGMFYGSFEDMPDTTLLLTSVLRNLLVLAFVWVLVRFGAGQGARALGLRFEKAGAHLRAGFLGYLALVPALLAVFSVVGWVIQRFSLELEPQAVVQMYLKPASEPFLVPLTLFVALAGPVMEEVLFRGFAFSGLRGRFGTFGAACVSSGAFALMHMSWVALVPVFLLGMALTYFYVHSRSLVPSIALHVAHNLVMVGLTLGFKGLSA